jgi:hypothetical protein
MEEGAEPKEYEQLLEAGKQILSQMHEKEHSLFFSFLAVLGFRLGALNLFCRCSTTYTIPQPFLLHFLCEVKFVVWEQFQTLILLPMPPSSWDYRHMSRLLVEMRGVSFCLDWPQTSVLLISTSQVASQAQPIDSSIFGH